MSRNAIHGGATATQPAIQAPPRNRLRLIMRIVVIVVLAIVFSRGSLLRWAASQPPLPATSTSSPPTPDLWTQLDHHQRNAATHVRRVLHPPYWYILRGAGLLSLLLLMSEWCAGVVRLVVLRRKRQRMPGLYRRIRTLQRTAPTNVRSGAAFFQAMHQVIAAGARHEWVAMTLLGRPDEPTELGMYVAGTQRATVLGAIRKIILGQAPGAVVDALGPPPHDDPFRTALQDAPGAVICYREYGLRLGPDHPLHLTDTNAVDPLGALAAALQPRQGVVQTQAQIIVQPDSSWAMHTGWRAQVLRRYLRLKRKQTYGVSPDVSALETKLTGPAFQATIRLCAIARDPTQVDAARAELDEQEAVLRQRAQRSGAQLQTFRRLRHGRIPVCGPIDRRRARMLVVLAALAGSALMWGLLHLAVVVPVTLPHPRTTVIPIPALVVQSLPRIVPPLLLLFGGLLGAWIARVRLGLLASDRLQWLLARAPRLTPPTPWIGFRLWRGPAILSVEELAGLWHFPTAALDRLVRWLPCQFLPAPPHAFLPDAATAGAAGHREAAEPKRKDGSAAWIRLGTGWHADGTPGPIGITLRDLRKVMAFTAGMGAGKTRLLVNMCRQFWPHGCFIFDGMGDDREGSLVANLRRLIPQQYEQDVILLDILDTEWPIGINPLAGIDLTIPGGKDIALGQLKAIFARLDPDGWRKSHGIQDYADNAIPLVMEGEPHGTIAHVMQVIVDSSYRAELLHRCTNDEIRFFWDVTFVDNEEATKNSREAFVRRLRKLLTNELTRYLITQANPPLDLLAAIEQQKIVLFPLPDSTLGDLAGAIGMLILQAVVRAASRRPGDDQTRTTYPFVADEFQLLIETGDPKDIQTALTRMRKLGIGGVYAHQLLKQLDTVKEEMLTNAGNRMILRTPPPDAETYAKQYPGCDIRPEDVARQDPKEHQYAVLLCNDTPTDPFSCKPDGWPVPNLDEEARLPEYTGPAWQTILPPGSDVTDQVILKLVYEQTSFAHPERVIAALAQLPAESWEQINTRWDRIRRYQLDYVLKHPECFPLPARPAAYATASAAEQAVMDQGRLLTRKIERQQWYSRLQWVQRPRILTAVDYARTRRALVQEDQPITSALTPGMRRRQAHVPQKEKEADPNFLRADPLEPSADADRPALPPPLDVQPSRADDVF